MLRIFSPIALPFALLSVACGSSPAPASPPEAERCALELPSRADWRIEPQGTVLRDALGRVVFLRGINAGGRSKFAPFAPFDFAPGEYEAALARYLDRAEAWGFSVLRVPFSWAAVEPSPGQDDPEFLARYDALLDAAWQRGLYTIVDFHQDIYSEVYCGDGFPAWTLPGPTPEPRHDCGDWFVQYSKNPDVRSAFDRFWSDENGTRTAFRMLWDRMAARHASRPGVIGFEPINEPHPGNADLATWSATTLKDFHTEMAKRIHEKAPDALVFFDATGTDAIGAATYLERPTGDRLVFAPHWYDYAALFGGTPSPANAAAGLAKWAEKGRDFDLPVLIGESSVIRDLETAGEFVTGVYDAMDENQLHFTYWEYSDAKEAWNEEDLSVVDYEGKEAKPVVQALARPFPRAVAGDEPSFRYDAAARVFTIEYKNAIPSGLTEIAVPPSAYPSGYRVELSTGCVDTSQANLLLVDSKGAPTVSLTIRPR